MIWPILPPVIMNAAITNVYSVIAVWMPVTSVPTSLATVAIDTFITDVSSVIRNWPAASVIRTVDAALDAAPDTAGPPGSGTALAMWCDHRAGRRCVHHPERAMTVPRARLTMGAR